MSYDFASAIALLILIIPTTFAVVLIARWAERRWRYGLQAVAGIMLLVALVVFGLKP